MDWRGGVAMAALVAAMLGRGAPPALAGDPGRLTLIEENDAFTSHYQDRHYTQGLRLSYLSGGITPDGPWDQPFGWVADAAPMFGGAPLGRERRIEWIVAGQSLFTPENLRTFNPDPRDRPYAGWLYTGASLLEDDAGRRLDEVELLAGVVGSAALGRQTQNDFHQFITVGNAHGWHHQLRNEPGVVASAARIWRHNQALWGGTGVEALPEVGASLGNVFTYGEVGGTVRFGQNLAADWGAQRIRPGLSGTGWFDADRMATPFGWYVFIGAQGRAMGRSIFLDGNSWERSAHVDKRPLVGDLTFGVSAFWTDIARLDFTFTERSKEFYGQAGRDRFGTISLSLIFW